MANAVAQNYLRTKVFTATPEQLLLMLYDGAIRFSEQARPALEQKRFDQSFELLCRAQKIITELTASLKRDTAPELCSKLASLYNFVYRKLIEANIEHTVGPLDEALDILRYQRQTWVLLLDQLGKSRAAAAASKLNMPEPSDCMERSISMQG